MLVSEFCLSPFTQSCLWYHHITFFCSVYVCVSKIQFTAYIRLFCSLDTIACLIGFTRLVFSLHTIWTCFHVRVFATLTKRKYPFFIVSSSLFSFLSLLLPLALGCRENLIFLFLCGLCNIVLFQMLTRIWYVHSIQSYLSYACRVIWNETQRWTDSNINSAYLYMFKATPMGVDCVTSTGQNRDQKAEMPWQANCSEWNNEKRQTQNCQGIKWQRCKVDRCK